MKWTDKRPQIGDSRYKVKFAFLPRRTKYGTTIWFERYISIQQFSEWKKPGPGYKGTRWVQGWVELDISIWSGDPDKIITNR
jgi:hypothetical protein